MCDTLWFNVSNFLSMTLKLCVKYNWNPMSNKEKWAQVTAYNSNNNLTDDFHSPTSRIGKQKFS